MYKQWLFRNALLPALSSGEIKPPNTPHCSPETLKFFTSHHSGRCRKKLLFWSPSTIQAPRTFFHEIDVNCWKVKTGSEANNSRPVSQTPIKRRPASNSNSIFNDLFAEAEDNPKSAWKHVRSLCKKENTSILNLKSRNLRSCRYILWFYLGASPIFQ